MNTLINAIIAGKGCSAIIAALFLIIFGLVFFIKRLWGKLDQWENDYKDIAEKYNKHLGTIESNMSHLKDFLSTIHDEVFRK